MVVKFETVLSEESMLSLKEVIRLAEIKQGSFLLQVFNSGEAVGFVIPPDLFDEVQVFLRYLMNEVTEKEG